MNRLFLAVVLALAVSVSAFASSAFTATGCTTDAQGVAIVVEVNDELADKHPVMAHIKAAFENAAKILTAAELQSEVGFYTFVGGLDEFDFQAIEDLIPPAVTGTCK